MQLEYMEQQTGFAQGSVAGAEWRKVVCSESLRVCVGQRI